MTCQLSCGMLSTNTRLSCQVPEWEVDNQFAAQLKDGFAFLSPCKQIRQEALPILLSNNDFVLHTRFAGSSSEEDDTAAVSEVQKELRKWLGCLGDNSKHLKKVTLTIAPSFTWSETDDYLCTFLPDMLRAFQSILQHTHAIPILSFEVYSEDDSDGVATLTVGYDGHADENIRAVQACIEGFVQRYLHLEEDFSNYEDSLEQLKRSKKTLQKLLEHFQSPTSASC